MRTVEITLDKPRKLRYDFNAVADIEEKAKMGIGAIFSEERIGFSTIRILIWGGLKWQDRHLTLASVGEWIQTYLDAGGDVTELMEKVVEAMELAGILGKQGNAEAGAAN